jgi:hypothetical protein
MEQAVKEIFPKGKVTMGPTKKKGFNNEFEVEKGIWEE